MARLELLTKEVEEAARSTQDKILGRVDALENEMVRDLGVILTELVELRELAQREFLSLFIRDQELTESHCPNVFTAFPKAGKWSEKLVGQKIALQLFCQAPGQWHPAEEGTQHGRYEIGTPAKFFKHMGPYILRLAKVIKYAAPLAGAAAGAFAGPVGAVMGAEYGKNLANQIKLMEELAKKLAHRDYGAVEFLERTRAGTRVERVEGMELRALRDVLNKEDPTHEWGGLKKVLTPEGHYFWLCEHHAAEYRI